MTRYLRTLRRFWSASFSAEMEYRANFVVATVVSVLNLVGGVFTIWLFFTGRDDLGGWSMTQALLVMGIFTLLSGVSDALLVPNLSRIVHFVQQGTLDYVLLKPIDSQYYLSTRNLSPWGLPNILFGLGVISYCVVKLDLPPSAFGIAALAVALAMAVVYSLWFMLASITIWFVKVYNVTHVLQSFMEAGKYPMSAFPHAYRVVLTFVIPVAFMTTVPAQLILGKAGGDWFAIAAMLAVGLFIVSRLWWRFALRFYTSASS